MNPTDHANVATINSRRSENLTTQLDVKHGLAWCWMHSAPRPCFTPGLLSDLNGWCTFMRQSADQLGLRYHALASAVPEVYNLGGDLDLFRRLVSTHDRAGLLAYGTSCINALHANIVHFDQDVTTISLVQGDALGGGFETALSSDVLIAERGARMGFPEILFNLFPGMGAYNLLSRRLSPAAAERMILSGRIYEAAELQQMGLVDVLVEEGDGEEAVYDYIRRENRARNGFRALRRVRDAMHPISFGELMRIVEIWVDAALRLETRDLRMMERLVARQSQKATPATVHRLA